MYWVYPYVYRAEMPVPPQPAMMYRAEMPVSPQPAMTPALQQSLRLIKEAVQGERNDELFYDELIRLAPNEEQRAIIESIRDDERGHNRMYRSIYKAFTGEDITGISNEEFIRPASYLEGIEKALFGELAAVEKYRTIWMGLPAGPYRDTVFGIILDELKHASKYNYLFTLNRTA